MTTLERFGYSSTAGIVFQLKDKTNKIDDEIIRKALELADEKKDNEP